VARNISCWTAHGAGAVIEFPEHVARIQHNLQGTTIFQNAETDNWMHLPLPGARILDGSHLEVTGVLFRAILNENARLDEIRLAHDDGIIYQRRVGYLGEDVWFEDLPRDMKQRWGGGLVLTLHIEFLSGEPRGRAQYKYGGVFTRRG
jgi:hypothetical protein